MKNRISRKHILFIALLVLVLGSIGVSLTGIHRAVPTSTANSSAGSAAEPAVVATVDGREITAKIYRMYLRNGVEALGLSERTADGRRRIELLKEGIISELIDRSLIENEARRRQLSIPQEQFEAAYKKRVSQMGGEQMYRSYLADHNLSDEEFRQTVAQEVFAERMQEELSRDLAVEPSEAKAFYEKEKSNPAFAAIFKEAESIRASHILIAARRSQIAAELRSRGQVEQSQLDRAIAEEMSKRRERALTVLSRLKKGADFASLARELSDDPGTRTKGGDLGLFTKNTHTAKFDEAAFALAAGRTSDIVETEYGYHIIKVAERRPERTRAFDEVREQIEKQLLARKRAEHLNRWLSARRSEARISVDPFYAVGQFKTASN